MDGGCCGKVQLTIFGGEEVPADPATWQSGWDDTDPEGEVEMIGPDWRDILAKAATERARWSGIRMRSRPRRLRNSVRLSSSERLDRDEMLSLGVREAQGRASGERASKSHVRTREGCPTARPCPAIAPSRDRRMRLQRLALRPALASRTRLVRLARTTQGGAGIAIAHQGEVVTGNHGM